MLASKSKRSVRSKVAGEDPQETGAKAPALAKRLLKTTAVKKTAAPLTPPEDEIDKENTPSMEDEEPVKAKITRTRKATKTPAKDEEVEVEVPRTTRATRTRK